MAEYQFNNSENSYSQEAERNTSEPVVLHFEGEPKPVEKDKKKSKKVVKNLAIGLLIVGLSAGSGALGAILAGGGETATEAPAQTTVSTPVVTMPGAQTANTALSSDGGMTYAQVAAKVKPSVVEITTEQTVNGSYFSQYVQSGAGSGVLITTDGYIITNNHVIEGATRITVRLTSGDEYEAKLIGTDSQEDIAVIKIEETDLPCATLGDSTKLAVGDEVLAVGNPLGSLGGSVTNGIISALDREIIVSGQSMTLLQTNAAINPGNSGGGLFNMRGELIAIVNAKAAGSDIEGLGFAIPINTAYTIATELMTNGYVSGRPAIGISYIEIDDYMDLMRYRVNSYGIYVYDGGETGLQNGDRIVRFGDYEVSSSATLKSALQSYKVGDKVTITVIRSGKYAEIDVTLIEDKPAETKIELSTEIQ